MDVLKKHWLTVSIVILLFICVIMLTLYFAKMSGGLSSNPSDWGAFGGYLGSITGLLAFSGVLYTVVQSNKAHRENSERDMFFKLLELHNNKVKSIEFKGKRGVAAFKLIVEIAVLNMKTLMITQDVIRDNKDQCMTKTLDPLIKKAVSLNTQINSKHDLLEPLIVLEHESLLDQLSNLIENKIDSEILDPDEFYKSFLQRRFFIEYENTLKNIKNISNNIELKYGHILGHYFTSIHNLIDVIDDLDNKQFYMNIFIAQLSRYEYPLILLHAIQYNPDSSFVRLLIKYEFFRGMYPDDLSIIASNVYMIDNNSEQPNSDLAYKFIIKVLNNQILRSAEGANCYESN